MWTHIPFISILLLLESKEIFSYDSEKIVIICIISFFLLSYYNFRELLQNEFINKSKKLQEEFINLLEKKALLEIAIENYYQMTLLLEKQIIYLSQ